jgi:tetratricopeptide (TPR) repeat protein
VHRRLALAGVVLLAFLPVLSNGFVNFDDPETIVENEALVSPGVLPWAFTTDRMSHFQPLSWLVWSSTARLAGIDPAVFHGLSLLFHGLNVVLLCGLISTLTKSELASLLGALLYAVHPLRVEPVAWASGFPYLLATTFLLVSTLLYLRGALLGSSLTFFGSILARPIAFAYPLVLLALDLRSGNRKLETRLVVEKLPFVAAAGVGVVLEGRTRRFLDLDAVGFSERLTLVSDSFVTGLARLVWPVGLTPLDPLPIEPVFDAEVVALGALLFLGTAWGAFRLRRLLPSAPFLWFCWLVLLVPTLGLAPSGLQGTADRYSYVPGLVLALAAGGVITRMRSRAARGVALAVAALLAGGTFRQCLWWKDSVTLWARAVELDPENDLALYFGASALSEAGRVEEAVEQYRTLLELVPDHGPARIDLARLESRKADALAEKGDLVSAVELYGRALDLAPELLETRERHAMALFQAQRFDEALPSLETAYRNGPSRPEISSALAALRNARGDAAGAVRVLEDSLSRFPDDVGLAHNLARLLATRPDLFPTRGEDAVALARAVVERTHRSDPRALDTLAIALSRAGSRKEALETFELAHRRAVEQGLNDLAQEIMAHAHAFAR